MIKVPPVEQWDPFPPRWLVLANIHKYMKALSYIIIPNCFYNLICAFDNFLQVYRPRTGGDDLYVLSTVNMYCACIRTCNNLLNTQHLCFRL